MPHESSTDTSTVHSRRQIAELLKRHGPQDAASLAERIGISAMAVRQHLYALVDERLVTFDETPRPRGRPAKLWRLTADANRMFPDAHAELTVSLVTSLGEAFGSDGVERLLEVRTRRQIESYREKLPKRAALPRMLEALAIIRTDEGYMAEVIPASNSTYLFVENHCSICAAATACMGLCASELTVFRTVLGEGVTVERTEHILAGDRRCAYAIRRKSSKSSTARPKSRRD